MQKSKDYDNDLVIKLDEQIKELRYENKMLKQDFEEACVRVEQYKNSYESRNKDLDYKDDKISKLESAIKEMLYEQFKKEKGLDF